MSRFDSFILLAEMRTGSNALEESLNQIEGVTCYGEAFNPRFVGQHDREALFGIDLRAREADPLALVAAMKDRSAGISGFRFFHDHDPRVLAALLPDPRCAKIVLTRNPLEAYVSFKIAQATGQWRLTDMKDRKAARPRFVAAEFEEMLHRLQGFQLRILRALQVSGQAAFYIGHEDIGEAEVLNGLAAFLGARGRLEQPSGRLKRQNPGPLREKVANPEEMEAALARLDRFDLGRTPNFEPRRGPAVPTYLGAVRAPLLFLPVKGGPTERIAAWLAALDDEVPESLAQGFSQKSLRAWKADRPGLRSFTVLSHPVARAHRVFCRYILPTGPGSFLAIRRALRLSYGLPLPERAEGPGPIPGYDAATHRSAFLGFLRFARGNLAGQTGLRTDPAWSSQAALVQGMAEATPPDHVLREADLAAELPHLAARSDGRAVPFPPVAEPGTVPLSQIHDAEIESAVRALHGRDYATFGFGDWSPG